MDEWISASVSVSCALSFTFPSVCSGLSRFVDVFVFVLSYIISYHCISYYIIIPLKPVCFLIREREWMDSDDRGVKEELGKIKNACLEYCTIKNLPLLNLFIGI